MSDSSQTPLACHHQRDPERTVDFIKNLDHTCKFISELTKTVARNALYNLDNAILPGFKTISWPCVNELAIQAPSLNKACLWQHTLGFIVFVAKFELPMGFRRLIFRDMDSRELFLDDTFLMPAIQVTLAYNLSKEAFGTHVSSHLNIIDILDNRSVFGQKLTKQPVRLLLTSRYTDLKLAPIAPGDNPVYANGLAVSFKCPGTSDMMSIADKTVLFEEIPAHGLSYINAFLDSEFDVNSFPGTDSIIRWAKHSEVAANDPTLLKDPLFVYKLQKLFSNKAQSALA